MYLLIVILFIFIVSIVKMNELNDLPFLGTLVMSEVGTSIILYCIGIPSLLR